jgi:glycosyltransferase involved in cell wall biosynthesis
VRHETRDPANACRALAPADVAILHLSIGTPLNALFRALPCRRVILYHNVTPAEYFRLYNPATCADLAEGRRQMAALAGAAHVNLADSSFNAAELEACGYRDVRVLPLLIDLLGFEPHRRDAAVERRVTAGARNVLFVGRCAPNKRIEDLLATTYLLQRHIEPRARLVHAGSFAGVEAYHTLLLAQARELGLRETLFLGPVTQDGLNSCYRAADLFLCLSAHEGFCAPLLEAMLYDVPVVALDAGAVAETLDGAGVLVRDRRLPLIAETCGAVLADPALRAAIVARQRCRVAAYRGRNVSDELRRLLAPVLGP